MYLCQVSSPSIYQGHGKARRKGGGKKITSVTHSAMKTLRFTAVADLCLPIQEMVLP